MAKGTDNIFEGVRFDSLDSDASGKHVFANNQPFTTDWYFALDGVANPYECYVRVPGAAGFQAASAGKGPGQDFHLYLNSAGITQLMATAEAGQLHLTEEGYRDLGAQFNTTTTSAFTFNVEGYLVANRGDLEVKALVEQLSKTYESTKDAGFIDAVEHDFLARVALTGIPHGVESSVSDVNAAFGTTFHA